MVADYATTQAKNARDNHNEIEAAKWDEGGVYRVALHAISGALGAAAVARVALDTAFQTDTEAARLKLGMDLGAAKMSGATAAAVPLSASKGCLRNRH